MKNPKWGMIPFSFLSVLVCFSPSCSHDNETSSVLPEQKAIPNSTVKPPVTPQPQNENAPKTLDEAHAQLEQKLSKEELAKIDAMKSEKEMIKYHMGLGMGIRNGWGLWQGSPLSKHMNNLGFFHPDDISGVILDTFWCKRHKKDFRLKERAAYYKTYWLAAAMPPPTAKDPLDQSEVKWQMSFDEGDDKNPRQIHIGKSLKTGRWLAYEYDKGWYVPDAELMKKIKDDEHGGQWPPR